MTQAAGPYRSVITSDGNALVPGASYQLPGYQFRSGANPLILLRRVAFFSTGTGKLDDGGTRALLRWASGERLGQDPALIADVERRRAHALEALRGQGLRCIRLRAQPEWRLAVGLGDKANAHEIGLSLHGTYGWPVIPGSSLKGLTAAWAVRSSADPAAVRRVLGTPRNDLPAAPAGQSHSRSARGTVSFLDAIPAGGPVTVAVDVLTPHVKPYYDSTRPGGTGPPVPPAEYHNPVPVNFLAVTGAYAVDLYGRDRDDLDLAVGWLTKAGDELGAGAKTAAGYGYLAIAPTPEGGPG